MYLFEVRTPILRDIIANLQAVSNGLAAGSLEPKEANTRIAAEVNIRKTVETDLKVRLAAPKLVEIEAKLIERERLGSIPTTATARNEKANDAGNFAAVREPHAVLPQAEQVERSQSPKRQQ